MLKKAYNNSMAFIYRNKNYEELNDAQMITDVLITHNKITADIRNILWSEGIIGFNGSTYLSSFELSRIFTDACLHNFIDRDKSLIHIDDDYSNACMTYENFIISPISDHLFSDDEVHYLMFEDKLINSTEKKESIRSRIQDKYNQYNKSVDKWYDFYMLQLDEKIKLLNSKKRIE